MIKSEIRYSSNPEDVKKYGTEDLRKFFLVDKLFVNNEIKLVYSMQERFIVGGAMPTTMKLKLDTVDFLKSENFLDRREIGIINVGGKGIVSVDGIEYELCKKEALYIGRGAKEVYFSSLEENKALFYINSAPAHASFPNKKVGLADAEVIQLGDEKHANKRVLNKLIVNSIVETCQLQMGLTELLEGNVWNTMPAHTHSRRNEVYFYFDIEKGQTLCHFMGQPDNTRHIFLQNNEAVISPEWSIHSGAGTTNYSFIWGMAGENLDYGDMDIIAPDALK